MGNAKGDNMKKEICKDDSEIKLVALKNEQHIMNAINLGYTTFVLCKKTSTELAIASLLICLRKRFPNIDIYIPISKMDKGQDFKYFKLFLSNEEWLEDVETIQISKLKKFVLCCENLLESVQIVDNLKINLNADIKPLFEF